MIIEISVAIIAVAFTALVIYLIAVFKTVRAILGQINQTVAQTRIQLGSLNPVFKAVENVGDVFERKTASFKEEVSTPVQQPVDSFTATSTSTTPLFLTETPITRHQINRLADILELIGGSIRLWERIKQRR